MGEVMDFPPRRAAKMIADGRFEEVVSSNTPALRSAVMAEGKPMEQDLQKATQDTYLNGNPMGQSPRKRAEWAQTAGVPVPIISQIKRPVEALWIVECCPSYEPRNQEISRKLARILNARGGGLCHPRA
jgi:hypothetical protein